MVPVSGLEPECPFEQGILSPSCLPIPPHRHIHKHLKSWRHHPDSDWGIKLLQSFALPLGHGAIILMERETRFELATFALARQRSTTEPLPRIGGNNRARTYDPLLVRQMLSQLSYASINCLINITNLIKFVNYFFNYFIIFFSTLNKSGDLFIFFYYFFLKDIGFQIKNLQNLLKVLLVLKIIL